MLGINLNLNSFLSIGIDKQFMYGNYLVLKTFIIKSFVILPKFNYLSFADPNLLIAFVFLFNNQEIKYFCFLLKVIY